jgi:hypothetical protein
VTKVTPSMEGNNAVTGEGSQTLPLSCAPGSNPHRSERKNRLVPSGRLSVQGTPPLTVDSILTEPPPDNRSMALTTKPPPGTFHRKRGVSSTQPALTIADGAANPPPPFHLPNCTTRRPLRHQTTGRVETAGTAFLSISASTICSQSGGSRPPIAQDHTSTARNHGSSPVRALDVE